ncbi:alpha amylase C-terminal domain-containing protein [Marivirga harenae]|uniref:alpha amylase C-terminal domain-containing protein n=1 Tax=Marivirga harenae TaxID=2010992 RepID=UPI0026E012E8|nr:alpha-amylase family glycosyl hydrolase [Marivirga harenae]WKV10565.1 alpha amylase C-terminal domain-containing protein [Marivirga harenae]
MLQIIQDDPWLAPYEHDIHTRYDYYKSELDRISDEYGSLLKFANRHQELGFQITKMGFSYKEWAPQAQAMALVGGFNNWDENAHPMKKDENGIWHVEISDDEGLENLAQVKVRVTAANGKHDRIPAYIKYAIQNTENYDFTGRIWSPKKEFKWTDSQFDLSAIKNPVIYEAHPGMAQEKEGVGTFKEFEENILPRIKSLGYNCIQLMAVAEHPYYGSFGYHVANFYAPSSRFGTPDDLKSLVNTAHKMGIAVIMDVVHSHSVKNFSEGLNDFDGSGSQYFHHGGRGYHTGWDSKLFNYGKEEVSRFLLSNLKYWLEDFHFDGFRFDGVTSMLYHHHGEGVSFDHYDKYFKDGVDWDAVRYLQLANTLIHEIKPHAFSIAEDMSGMPGMCQPIEAGGLGFDYRLGMGIPDNWIKWLKHKQDEEWSMQEIWNVLSNRRYGEKTVAYAESHDQAMVGDKTLAFWLMDKEMYWHMAKGDDNLIIDRGISLHKMIRLVTAAAGGEAYLNFIGNEFGHPEWMDFPREGNNWSYKYARRQWSLVDNQELKYHFLNDFEKAMLALLKNENVLEASPANLLNIDETNKVLIFERSNLIFVFNFHPNNSVPDYEFWVPSAGMYQYLLNSDDARFGGHKRIDESTVHESFKKEGGDFIKIYCVNRTALVIKRK